MLPVHNGAVTDSALITKSSGLNLTKLIVYYYWVTLVTTIGTLILAPESLPITVNVVYRVDWEPNNELTVVAVILIVVPTIVLLTFVPIVEVEFKACASAVLIPTPVKLEVNLTSPITAT